MTKVGIATGAARGMGAACADRLTDMVDVLLLVDRDEVAVVEAAKTRAGAEPVALGASASGWCPSRRGLDGEQLSHEVVGGCLVPEALPQRVRIVVDLEVVRVVGAGSVARLRPRHAPAPGASLWEASSTPSTMLS